jgi:hypothetical protein
MTCKQETALGESKNLLQDTQKQLLSLHPIQHLQTSLNQSVFPTHLGKLIPGRQRSAQMSYDSPINQENSLLLTTSKPHPLNQPQTDQHFSSTNHTYLLNPVL